MAFQAPNTGQEKANRKILEQLEEQKKRLRMQTQPGTSSSGTANTVAAPAQPAAPTTQSSLSEQQHMTPAQRAALQHAHANSVGYFITQDSSFGNLILPVLPRFETAKPS